MIRFITSGISTTIQDLGRFGYRKHGVPVSGAMDQISSRQANEILGNEANCAALEMVVKGPILQFEEDCWISLTGATIQAELDEKMIEMYKAIFISAGQVLKLGSLSSGRYTYMAVKGGIQSEVVLNSRSQFKGITKSNRCTKGMVLYHANISKNPENPQQTKVKVNVKLNVNVSKGPEFDQLPVEIQKKLLSAKFTVSPNSNRTGFRLESNKTLHAPEIITSPVQPGTVQLTPSGELIILGQDAGVSGGYARIFQLDEDEFSSFVQQTEQVSFQLK